MSSFRSDGQFVAIGVECTAFVPYIFTISLCLYANIWLISQIRTGKISLFAHKRSMFLILGLNLSLFYAIIALLFAHIGIYYVDNTTVEHVYSSVSILFFLSGLWIILYFLNVRNWLIFWNYQHAYSALQLHWQQLINKNVNKDNETNCFIRNNHKYGQLLHVAKLSGMYASFGWFIFFISTVFPSINHVTLPIGFILLILFIIFYMVITCKTPYQSDTFYIHYESRIHSRLLLVIGLGLATMVMTIEFLPALSDGTTDQDDEILIYIFVGSFLNVMNVVFCAMNLVSVRIIDRSNKQRVTVIHKSKGNKDTYNLQLILTNKKAINLFMIHLGKEYVFICRLSVGANCVQSKLCLQ